MSKIMLMLCIAASAQTDTILLQDEQDSGMIIEEPQCVTVFLSEHGGYLALYQYRWVDGDRIYLVNDSSKSVLLSANENQGFITIDPGKVKVFIHRQKSFFEK